MRTIIIGDIHGCIDELEELIYQLDITQDDEVISVGDVVDRGPDSKSCLDVLNNLNAIIVLGNHEEKLLRYYRHKENRHKPNPMTLGPNARKSYDSLTQKDIEAFATYPIYHEFTHSSHPYAVIHGGVLPGTKDPLNDTKMNWAIRLRYVDTETQRRLIHINDLATPQIFWADGYDQRYAADKFTQLTPPAPIIIYGHAVTPLPYAPRINRLAIGLDTACVFGGRLTAAVFTENEINPQLHQVKAQKQYSPPYTPGDE